eukprot:SAG11_NODE_57_length_19200_cov_18.288417_1_plen_55_part_00
MCARLSTLSTWQAGLLTVKQNKTHLRMRRQDITMLCCDEVDQLSARVRNLQQVR